MLVHVLIAVFLRELPYSSAQAGGDSGGPSRPLGPSFDPRMVVIVMIFIVFLFVISFVLLCIRHRVSLNRGPQTVQHAGVGSRQRRTSPGLDAEAIEKFPTFAYSSVKGLKIGEDKLECAICLNEFEDDETLRLIPHCNHVFHRKCVDEWLPAHATCPVCRANLMIEPNKTDILQPLDTTTNQIVDLEIGETSGMVSNSPDANLSDSMKWTNSNWPRRTKSSESSRRHYTGSLLRSNSTGHTIFPPNENLERFTLRLPENIRNALVKSASDELKSHVALHRRARSSREGYRSSRIDEGAGRINKFKRAFSLTDRFLGLTGSVKSPNDSGNNQVGAGASKSLTESIKSPINCFNLGRTDGGERSSNGLWAADSKV